MGIGGNIAWRAAIIIAVPLLPVTAAAQSARNADPVQPRLAISAHNYSQSGDYQTGNPFSDHAFDARASGVSAGLRVGEQWTIAVRAQRARTDVNLTPAAPQSMRVESDSYGLRAVLNGERAIWDTTTSYGVNDNSTSFPDLFGGPPSTAQWRAHEWVLDSSLSATLPVSRLVVEPLAGLRVISLHDQGFRTGDGLLGLPAQRRSDTSFRARLKVSAPFALDSFSTLTPWLAGEIRHSFDNHPPIGSLTDLTGMAGGHYVLNRPDLEGTRRFPDRNWRSASAGLDFEITRSFSVKGMMQWSDNDAGSWRGYRVDVTLRF